VLEVLNVISDLSPSYVISVVVSVWRIFCPLANCMDCVNSCIISHVLEHGVVLVLQFTYWLSRIYTFILYDI
jgi:hypothetical protein